MDESYLCAAVAAFKARHGHKPAQVVVGLAASVALAAKGQLWAEASSVPVVTRPLAASDRPAEPGKGARLFVEMGPTGLRATELF